MSIYVLATFMMLARQMLGVIESSIVSVLQQTEVTALKHRHVEGEILHVVREV